MASPGRELERSLFCEDSSVPSSASFESASPAMRAFGRLLVDAARQAVPALLLGESGAGKTTFARAVHAMSDRSVRPFVRVDCAAPVGDLSLEAEMAAGRFRKDLFYRLDILEIRVPPLRERTEDILPIARAFLASAAGSAGHRPPELSPAVERALLRYSWAGNVQELLSVLQRLIILSRGDQLDLAALPDRVGFSG